MVVGLFKQLKIKNPYESFYSIYRIVKAGRWICNAFFSTLIFYIRYDGARFGEAEVIAFRSSNYMTTKREVSYLLYQILDFYLI